MFAFFRFHNLIIEPLSALYDICIFDLFKYNQSVPIILELSIGLIDVLNSILLLFVLVKMN